MRITLRPNRRGSALLVCTLAAAVLSMAGIAILRSSRLRIAQVDATRAAEEAHCVREGLLQRSLAVLKENEKFTGTLNDPDSPLPEARAEITSAPSKSSRIQIFLYAGAAAPAEELVVKPKSLGKDAKPKTKKKKGRKGG